MKTSSIQVKLALTRHASAVLAAVLAAGALALPAASAEEGDDNKDSTAAATGLSANMHFTDEQGNRRLPAAAEIRAAAEAFHRDLARIAGQQRGGPQQQVSADGTVRATVAPSKLVFLTVETADDGSLLYRHATLDEDGEIRVAPAAFPEE